MIDRLSELGALTISRSRSGAMGYRFSGDLYEAFETLDSQLRRVLSATLAATPHSCASLIDPEQLQRIGYLKRLPSIPYFAVPHGSDMSVECQPDWALTPAACYSTFAHLEGLATTWDLVAYTTRGRCHRHEPSRGAEARMSSFEMRELVLLGGAENVVREANAAFQRVLSVLRSLGLELSVVATHDIFYGEDADMARRVQSALGLKQEAQASWRNGNVVAVGSRNVHRELFTKAFAIGPQQPDQLMHSACVAFGLDRLVLSLLAIEDSPDPTALLDRLMAIETVGGIPPL
jgi:seryl-tRNA synthetase